MFLARIHYGELRVFFTLSSMVLERKSPWMSENYTSCIPSTGSAFTTVPKIKSDVEFCTTHLRFAWEHSQVLSESFFFFRFLKVDNFSQGCLRKFIFRVRAYINIRLQARYRGSWHAIQEYPCSISLVVPGHWVFLAFCTKIPPLSAPLNFDAKCFSPEIHKIIIISALQMHSYE